MIGGLVLSALSRTMIGLFWSISWLPVGYLFDFIAADICGVLGATVTWLIVMSGANKAFSPTWLIAAAVGTGAACSTFLWYLWLRTPGEPMWIVPTNVVLAVVIFGIFFGLAAKGLKFARR
jgi:drug/metabolite transporter superfamily protein YnfA